MITHDDLLIIMAVMLATTVLGFTFLGYLIWDSHRHDREVLKAIAGLIYQEGERTRRALS